MAEYIAMSSIGLIVCGYIIAIPVLARREHYGPLEGIGVPAGAGLFLLNITHVTDEMAFHIMGWIFFSVGLIAGPLIYHDYCLSVLRRFSRIFPRRRRRREGFLRDVCYAVCVSVVSTGATHVLFVAMGIDTGLILALGSGISAGVYMIGGRS